MPQGSLLAFAASRPSHSASFLKVTAVAGAVLGIEPIGWAEADGGSSLGESNLGTTLGAHPALTNAGP
ncbi:hypothetical protein O181_098138 [Austropuccinia psidii MF-1]|uniref:Uncharacterized protein n=1 Tax=Austropuccinia psidii MF-1 TaxID=1389203 RepID=A0A9Q3PDV0_9BASI|nr:hypothetical protein [Austropuccinia psidii MF-1]